MKIGFSRKLLLLLLLAVVAACFGLSGCDNATFSERSYFAMDTIMDVKIDGGEDLFPAVGNLISLWDAKLSATNSRSLVCALNNGETVRDPETAELFRRIGEICLSTDGAFDPTVRPLICAWGFSDKNYRVPSQTEIEEILPKVGYEKIIVENGEVTVSKGVSVDLGAVGKGFLSDVLKAYLTENGVKNALLNLGGNVTALGKKNGSDWKVAIKDPVGDGYVGVMTLSDRSAVTSGLYERYFEQNGKKYGHILDPKTGYPVENDLLSVTVVGEDATLCDALSTALFVMGLSDAVAYVRENSIDALFITNDGVYLTETVDKHITLSGSYAARKKTVISW